MVLNEQSILYWEADSFSSCLIRSLNLAATSYSSSEIAFSKASFKFSNTVSSEVSLVNNSYYVTRSTTSPSVVKLSIPAISMTSSEI